MSQEKELLRKEMSRENDVKKDRGIEKENESEMRKDRGDKKKR